MRPGRWGRGEGQGGEGCSLLRPVLWNASPASPAASVLSVGCGLSVLQGSSESASSSLTLPPHPLQHLALFGSLCGFLPPLPVPEPP